MLEKFNWIKILRPPDLVFVYDKEKQYQEIKEGFLRQVKDGDLEVLLECNDLAREIRIWRKDKK